MDLFLGIDGGGTGCRAALADATGHVLATATAGPANIASDFSGAVANILTAAQIATQIATQTAAQTAAQIAAAGHDMARITCGLGLAGANAAGASDRLAQALPFARLAVETDAITALRGALAARDGIVAAIGTGSVFACRRAGVIRQIGGWGLALGDEGSGAWLGRAILSDALRAVDGFLPDSALLQALRDDLGGAAGVVGFSLTARPADYATFAPRIVDSDDPAAQALMARADAAISGAIDLLRGGGDLPVVFLGGLGPVYARRLHARFPMMAAQGTALDGALQLAFSLRDGARGAA